MKSRMFIVDENTLDEARRTCIVKTKIPFKDEEDKATHTIHRIPTKHFVNSINSMMADMLQLEIGDYVFFWCEKEEFSFKSTITGVYRVISQPYFKFDNENDVYPFKVHIEEAYHFEKPITEYNVLNSPSIKSLLWNIIGKKTSGKPRGSIQITPAEASTLLSLLISENPDYTYIPENRDNFIELPSDVAGCEPLSIDLNRTGDKQKRPDIDCLHQYDIYSFVHLNRKRRLHNEKTLEGLFNQKIINRDENFFSQLNIDVHKIIWFGNYLPYSLDRTEMDYLIVSSDDGSNPSKAYVIEFKKENINDIPKDTHFYRAMLYSKWVNENLFNGSKITKPIIICEESPNYDSPADADEQRVVEHYINLEKEHASFNIFPVEIYTVDFSGKSPVFDRKK